MTNTALAGIGQVSLWDGSRGSPGGSTCLGDACVDRETVPDETCTAGGLPGRDCSNKPATKKLSVSKHNAIKVIPGEIS